MEDDNILDKEYSLVVYENPYFEIRKIIDSFKPEKNQLLKSRLMEFFLSLALQAKNVSSLWSAIELIMKYWHKRIEYHLEFVWKAVYNKKIDNTVKIELIEFVSKLIEEAKKEHQAYCRKCYFSHQNYHKQIMLLKSILHNPLKEGDVRYFLQDLDVKTWTYSDRILNIEKDDPGNDLVDISPEEPLPDWDLMGQQLRDMGLVDCSPLGHVAVGKWNFRVLETSEKQFGVPIEEIIFEFGGCPYGYVDTINQGYVKEEKSCKCFKRQWCIGGKLFSFGTLEALAKGLRRLYQCMDVKFLEECTGMVKESNKQIH
jgi:hypothetical protein